MSNYPDARFENPAMQEFKHSGYAELDKDHPVGGQVVEGFWLSPSYTHHFTDGYDTGFVSEVSVVYNNITWKENKPQFNGTSSSIELFSGHNLLQSQNPERRLNSTFSCEFMLDDLTARRTICGGYGGALTIYYDNVSGKLRVEKPGTGTRVESTATIVADQVYRLDYTNDFRGLTDGINFHFLYLDGELDSVGTTASNFVWPGNSFKLGVNESSGEYWSGMIDMPMFCSPRLSADIISTKTLYGHFTP